MLVGERLLDTRPGGGPLRRKLDPRPDETIDASARYPALKRGEGGALMRLANLHDRGEAAGARDVAPKDDGPRDLRLADRVRNDCDRPRGAAPRFLRLSGPKARRGGGLKRA